MRLHRGGPTNSSVATGSRLRGRGDGRGALPPSVLGVVDLVVQRTLHEYIERLLPQCADTGLKEENRPGGYDRDHGPSVGQKLGETVLGLGLQLVRFGVLTLAIGRVGRPFPPVRATQMKPAPLSLGHAEPTGAGSGCCAGLAVTLARSKIRAPTKRPSGAPSSMHVQRVESSTGGILRRRCSAVKWRARCLPVATGAPCS